MLRTFYVPYVFLLIGPNSKMGSRALDLYDHPVRSVYCPRKSDLCCFLCLIYRHYITLHYITLLCLVPGLQQPGPARQYKCQR